MKTPNNEKNNPSEFEGNKDMNRTEKEEKLLTDKELDSIAGGVAPIIRPPLP